MAEGGFGETDPLMEHTDDRDDNDDGNVSNTTGPFQPGEPEKTSTPDQNHHDE